MEDTINVDGGLTSRETDASRHYVGNKVKTEIISFRGLPVSDCLYHPRINNVDKPGGVIEFSGNINHHKIYSYQMRKK